MTNRERLKCLSDRVFRDIQFPCTMTRKITLVEIPYHLINSQFPSLLVYLNVVPVQTEFGIIALKAPVYITTRPQLFLSRVVGTKLILKLLKAY